MASKVIRIPHGKDGARQGADDVIATAGDATFGAIVDSATPAHATASDVLHAAGLDALGKKSSPEDIEAALRKLRANVNGADPLRRATIRDGAIDLLDRAGVRSPAGMVDAAIGSGPTKADDDGQGKAIVLSDPEPWPEPVDGAQLLNDLLDVFRRYLVLPAGAAVAFALWILHTYAFDLFMVSPFLSFISATKRAGKSRSLTITAALVPRPLIASSVTAAVLFRAIEKFRPTLIVDEFDTLYRNDEALRGLLNSGHTRSGAFALRTVGDDFEPRLFSTWAPKAIAAIGDLPETIGDRAITISMRRRKPDEKIARLRLDHQTELEHLRQKAARWARDNADALRAADPVTPAGLGDRAADNWLPLFAIADLVGGLWPEDARLAAVRLSGATDEGDQNVKVQLLNDVRGVFADHSDPEHLATETIVDALAGMDDRPWPEWRRGKPITAVQLGRLLRPFGVASTQVWIRGQNDIGQNRKGYKRESFADAWARYLAPIPSADPRLAPRNFQEDRPEPAPEAESSPLAAQNEGATDG